MADLEGSRKRILARLRRAQGQVGAIAAMVEREADCEQVAQQLSAVRKALDKTFFDVMACAIEQQMASLGVSTEEIESGLRAKTELLTRYG